MAILLKNICKRFENTVVFENRSFEISENAVTCVTGGSGRGKTTLLRMLAGLENPDSGAVSGLSGKRVSMVFQEDRLCESMTASANVRMVMPRLRPARQADMWLEPLGLSGCADRRISALSGGMRRRVALARALAAEYDLLILDEPFTGLDAETRGRAIRLILETLNGRPAVIASHDPEVPALMGANILPL